MGNAPSTTYVCSRYQVGKHGCSHLTRRIQTVSILSIQESEPVWGRQKRYGTISTDSLFGQCGAVADAVRPCRAGVELSNTRTGIGRGRGWREKKRPNSECK